MEEPTTPGRDGQSTTGHFRELDIEFLIAQAKEWLEAVLGEDLDGSSSLEDLLADGCLLFRVSQHIRDDINFPGHVESVSSPVAASPSMEKKNSMKYQPYASVEAFLKVCKEVGLQDLDVFNPSDAVEKKDIRRLCVCLRRFSKKGRTLGIQVPDFDNVKDTLVTPGKMPRDVVRRTQESLRHSSSRSSRSSSAYGLASNENSSLKDDADSVSLKLSESYNKVHHDLDVAAGSRETMVNNSKYNVRVAEPGVGSLASGEYDEEDGRTKEVNSLALILSGVDSTHGPVPKAAKSDSRAHGSPEFVDRNQEAATESSADVNPEPVVKSPSEVLVAEKQVEPFRGLVVDKLKPRPSDSAVGERSNVEPSEQRRKGLFSAHLQGKEPYVTKQVKEIKNDGKNGSFSWLFLLGGAVAIAGGVAGLLFTKKRFDPDDSCDDQTHTSMNLYSGNLYRVRKGDNLTQIAERVGKKHWREIADKNPSINSPNLIYPGDCLEL